MYKTFSILIEKKVGNEDIITISYKIKFTDSSRFMASSLSSLVDNNAGGIYKIKCNNCDCFLEHENVKDKRDLAKKIIQTSLMKNHKSDSRAQLSFLIMASINLFCC